MGAQQLHIAHCEVRCHKIFVSEKYLALKKISTLKKENREAFMSKIISLLRIENYRN